LIYIRIDRIMNDMNDEIRHKIWESFKSHIFNDMRRDISPKIYNTVYYGVRVEISDMEHDVSDKTGGFHE